MKFDQLCESLLLEYFVLPYSEKRELKKMILDSLRNRADKYELLVRCRDFLRSILIKEDFRNLKTITDKETIERIVDDAIEKLKREDEIYHKISSDYLSSFVPPKSVDSSIFRRRSSPLTRQKLF